MYCLDCGQKIADSDTVCPQCGLSVSEMRARIEKAQEMVTYAETVGLDETHKLPLVAERTYTGKDGKELRPEDSVDLTEHLKHLKGDARLHEIPNLAGDDPYVTMPIKKIVSDTGQVVADVDLNQKIYQQETPRQPFWTGKKVAALVVVLVIIVAACVGAYWFLQTNPLN